MTTPAQTPADVVEVAKRLAERVAELEEQLEQREAELHATDVARLEALAGADELAELLEDAVNQACYRLDNLTVDSMAQSAYAAALRALARRGAFLVTFDRGRRVIGRWTPPDERAAQAELARQLAEQARRFAEIQAEEATLEAQAKAELEARRKAAP